jgi:methylenetetrahydrofolate dehydrogenase (NADP+)/methenyltetrahydrofolate cyclohydrolase
MKVFQGLNIYKPEIFLMTGIKIDGKEIAQSVKNRVIKAVEELKNQGINPCLATVLVGDNQASATYVKNKHKACEEVGILTKDFKLASNITQLELNKIIDELNTDRAIHGILVQLPLPDQLDEFITTSKISPLKDVDGLTPHNAGLLAMRKAVLVACTPLGVMEMFDYHNIELAGKTIVLINRSNLVGKPLYHLLLARDATVITCHSKTKNIKELCHLADIIITAVGDRNKFTLTPDMIKKDAIVIDVAISKHKEKLVGDADYEQIIQKASYATPVPGGVGPMTVAMLLKNTITAASLSSQIGK